MIPTAILSQTEKGKVFLGLSSRMGVYSLINTTSTDIFSLGFSSIKIRSDADGYEEPPSDKLTSINLAPRFGLFIVKNFGIGFDLSYVSFNYTEGTSDDKTRINQLGIGPFVRYYIQTNKVLPFIEANVSFGMEKCKYNIADNNSVDNYHVFVIGGGGGIAFPIGKKVTFDLTLGYNSYSEKLIKNNHNNIRSVVGTIGIRLGFLLYLGSPLNGNGKE
jgi:hypothetical protein